MDKATVYRQFIFQVQGLVAALIQFTQTYKKIMIAFWRIFAFKKGKCFEIPIIFIKNVWDTSEMRKPGDWTETF